MTIALSASHDSPFGPPLGPLHSEHITRGDRLWQGGRADEALAAYGDELASETGDHFTRSFAHKRIVSLLIATQGLDRAFAQYRLTRVDDNELSIAPGEVLCCATVRDEADRLPFFLDYYERLGVDRFLVIDNESRDETRELLLDRPNVHLWRTDMHYARANYGMAWIEVVLRAYGRDHWCLVVDADEMLYYPELETRSLHDLCASLDQQGSTALPAVLLDMYSDGPLRDATCHPGKNPLEICRFFDRDFCHSHQEHATPWRNIDGFSGGVRRRVFGDETDVFLSKVPLIRYTDDQILFAGMHGTDVPGEQVAYERGALLHVKFTARFVERLEEEIQSRSEWSAQSEPYSRYESMLNERPNLSLYHPLHSVELRESRQLAALGIMRNASAAIHESPTDPAVARDHHLRPLLDRDLDGIAETDARVFRAIDSAHQANDVHGNIIEIGGIVERAIVLSQLLRPGEQLLSWDRQARTAQDVDPDLHLVSSSSERRCRIAHVDGSQEYDVVRDDISTALGLLVDSGVLVIDQCHKLPYSLGVAAAVWNAVAEGTLVPVLASEQRLYGYAAGRRGATAEWLEQCASGQALAVDHVVVAGHDVMVVAPLEPFDETAELRQRLALIEGSRTWRLRTTLARWLPTRR
jgi:hypothetical protein